MTGEIRWPAQESILAMAVRRASYKSPFLFMISSALSWVTRIVGRTMRHTEAAMGDLLQRVSEEFRTLFPPRTLRCFFELGESGFRSKLSRL
jgi:hypothetical protein